MNIISRIFPFLDYMDLANFLTATNLAVACGGLYAASTDNLLLAAIFIAIATVIDFLDGHIARTYLAAFPDRRSFGKQLDSLSDLSNFSIVPALLVFQLFFGGFASAIVACLLVLSGALRLALFGAISTSEINRYIGLPTTYSAAIFAVTFIVIDAGKLPPSAVLLIALAISILQLSGLSFRKYAALPTIVVILSLYVTAAIFAHLF